MTEKSLVYEYLEIEELVKKHDELLKEHEALKKEKEALIKEREAQHETQS